MTGKSGIINAALTGILLACHAPVPKASEAVIRQVLRPGVAMMTTNAAPASNEDLFRQFLSPNMLVYFTRKCPDLPETELRLQLDALIKNDRL